VKLFDRDEFLRLTGLSEEQLAEVEAIGLVIPSLSEGGSVRYDQEDVTVASEAVRQVYALGIDPKRFEFYVTLGHRITDEEVAFRREFIRGMSSKSNAEVTTRLTRAGNLFRSYILRRLFQQKIQSRIQRSLGRKDKG
jgi:DNA-binding transcriptional MerR regulator